MRKAQLEEGESYDVAKQKECLARLLDYAIDEGAAMGAITFMLLLRLAKKELNRSSCPVCGRSF